MASEWREVHFGDIAETLPGKYLPASAYDPDGDFVIYGSNSVMGRASHPLYEGPIIAFARIGSNCGATMFSPRPCCINNNAAGIRAKAGADTRFLFYWMQSFDFSLIREGSGQPYISQRTLDAQIVHLPPLPEQRAIAHILGTLDDKIELNRRMSQTLEAMARALFKAWFVDFEPVRAKMEGRWQRGQSLPGLPAHLYDLFPDRLVDSELGEIPEGWRVGTLGEYAEITSGKRPGEVFENQSLEAVVPLWGGNGPMAYVREPLFTQPILLTGRVGTLGSVFRIMTPCWPSDNTLVVLPWKGQYFEYLYLSMKRFDFESLNRGPTQPLLTQTDLKNHPLIVPTNALFNVFHSLVAPMFAKTDTATYEASTLAALRDALLPKLIFGELRVKDAERFLKERGL